MALKQIKQRFNKEGDSLEERSSRRTRYNLEASVRESAQKQGVVDDSVSPAEVDMGNGDGRLPPKQGNQEYKKNISLPPSRKKAYIIGAVALGFIALVASTAVIISLVREATFNENRVEFFVEGDEDVKSGELVNFRLFLDNKNRAKLRDVSIVVQHPASFRPEESEVFIVQASQKGVIDIGDVEGGEEMSFSLPGSFFGSSGDILYMDFALRYATNEGNGRFEKRERLALSLSGSAIVFDIVATSEATAGEDVEYTITYGNEADDPIYNAILYTTVSDRFFVETTVPQSTQRETSRIRWDLGTIDPGEKGTVTIRGAYFQQPGTTSGIEAELGYILGDGSFYAIVNEKSSTSVIPTLLSARLESSIPNGVVRVGQRVNFTLNYANSADVGLSGIIVQAVFEGDIWDFDSLSLRSGRWNSETKTITWRASDESDLSELAPNDEGMISFSVPTRSSMQVNGANDSNFRSGVTLIVDSPDTLSRLGLEDVEGRDAMEFKLQTFVDTVFEIEEAGSGIPLGGVDFEVGEEKIIDTRIQLKNPYNNVENAKLMWSIPSEVEWEGFLDGVDEETVSYNERTRQIVWDIGTLRAGTGLYRDGRGLGFSIRFIPEAYQKNSRVTVIKDIRFSGFDTFVGQEFSFEVDDKMTRSLRWDE